MVKATALVVVYYAGLLAIVAAPWAVEGIHRQRQMQTENERKSQSVSISLPADRPTLNPTVNAVNAVNVAGQIAPVSQYWHVERLSDGEALVVCDNGDTGDPADATIRPTDRQDELIIDCGAR